MHPLETNNKQIAYIVIYYFVCMMLFLTLIIYVVKAVVHVPYQLSMPHIFVKKEKISRHGTKGAMAHIRFFRNIPHFLK